VGHLGQVVDLLLGEPGLLVLEREYLDGHLLLAQLTLPHSAEPASRLDLQQLYGPKQEAVKMVAGSVPDPNPDPDPRFLGLPDPDPALDPSIINKYSRKNFDFYGSVTSF
jgi:hypothetical protein